MLKNYQPQHPILKKFNSASCDGKLKSWSTNDAIPCESTWKSMFKYSKVMSSYYTLQKLPGSVFADGSWDNAKSNVIKTSTDGEQTLWHADRKEEIKYDHHEKLHALEDLVTALNEPALRNLKDVKARWENVLMKKIMPWYTVPFLGTSVAGMECANLTEFSAVIARHIAPVTVYKTKACASPITFNAAEFKMFFAPEPELKNTQKCCPWFKVNINNAAKIPAQ